MCEKILPNATGVMAMVGSTAEFAQAVYFSLVMEEIRFITLSEILAKADAGSALQRGISRLQFQLQTGFCSYFWNTYVVNKALESVSDLVKKAVNGVIGAYDTDQRFVSCHLITLDPIAEGHTATASATFPAGVTWKVLVLSPDGLCPVMKAKSSQK